MHLRGAHSDSLPDSWAVQELGGWNESSSVRMDVVTAAEKLGDWRVAWMCCSISAGRWERDWFSVSVTAVSSAWFAGGLSGPRRRERAATSACRLRRSWLSAVLVKELVVMDEIDGWLLGWMCGPFVQLF